jgi:hypothetical protein
LEEEEPRVALGVKVREHSWKHLARDNLTATNVVVENRNQRKEHWEIIKGRVLYRVHPPELPQKG